MAWVIKDPGYTFERETKAETELEAWMNFFAISCMRQCFDGYALMRSVKKMKADYNMIAIEVR